MPKIERKIQKDGFNALLGVDSSVSPSLIAPPKAAFAGNCFFRGGFPQTRAGFDQLPLNYPTVEIAEWIENNVLQGGIVYQPKYGDALLVVSVGGRIFTIDPLDNWLVREITPVLLTSVAADFAVPAVGFTVVITVTDGSRIYAGYPIMVAGGTYDVVSKIGNVITIRRVNAPPDPVATGASVIILDVNSDINPRAWMKQAEFFLIIQDGQARAIIFDGTTAFRSDPAKQQIPTGTVMAYGIGRLWVAVNRNEFVASDIVRGSSGTAFYDRVDAILFFKENSYLAGGGAFSVPIQSGEITAMEFMPVLDTSTGNGPLIVFTERGAFSVNAPADRTAWSTVRSAIQTIVLTGNGATSAYATVATTNSDIFFRAPDGLRSFVLAIREYVNSWGNTPISTELHQILDKDDPVLLRLASALQFDNRLWFTVSPLPLPAKEQGAYHQGVATLDFHPISNMATKSPPAYDGIHSGIRPTLLFKGIIDGRERAFCWSLNQDNHNELWEISKDKPFDNEDGRIKCFLETRSMPFKDIEELLMLMASELRVKGVKGLVNFRLLYKSDDYPCWIEWGRGETVCTTWRNCPEESSALCTTAVSYRPGYKTRINFGQPLDQNLQADDKPARFGYEFQFRIEWEGCCTIRRFIARAQEIDEEPYSKVG